MTAAFYDEVVTVAPVRPLRVVRDTVSAADANAERTPQSSPPVHEPDTARPSAKNPQPAKARVARRVGPRSCRKRYRSIRFIRAVTSWRCRPPAGRAIF